MDTPDLSSFFNRLGWSVPLFLVSLLALWGAKLVYQATERFSFDDELTEKDNPAFGTALAGYLLGVTIALTGAYPGLEAPTTEALLRSVGFLAGQAVLVALLMRVSVWTISRGVLHRFGVREELIRDRNLGTGAVVGGGCVASGLVLHGALTGNSATPLLGVRDLLVFWAVGQAILIGGAFLFTKVVRFDVLRVLEEEDNAPAGFSLGGFLVALGITINGALAGAGSDLSVELGLTVAAAAVGLLLLVLSAIVTARLLLPASPVSKEIAQDRNAAAGLISGVAYIAVAVLLARIIAP